MPGQAQAGVGIVTTGSVVRVMFTGRTIMKCYCLIFVVALLTSTNGLAEIYKCSDAQGNVQYADKPCAGESSVITPRSAPKVDENSEQRMQKGGRSLVHNKRRDHRKL